MYVRWQSRKRTRAKFGSWYSDHGARLHDTHWSAILVENERVDGKPKQQHIAYLVGFTESAVKIPAQRCFLWDQISACLDRLGNRMTADDRAKIEAAVAQKVPRPTAAEYKKIARQNARAFGWKYLTEEQRSALQGEAARWQARQGDVVRRIRAAKTA